LSLKTHTRDIMRLSVFHEKSHIFHYTHVNFDVSELLPEHSGPTESPAVSNCGMLNICNR